MNKRAGVLLLCRFPAIEQTAIPPDQLLWTTATLEWGNDIGLPSAADTAASTP